MSSFIHSDLLMNLYIRQTTQFTESINILYYTKGISKISSKPLSYLDEIDSLTNVYSKLRLWEI